MKRVLVIVNKWWECEPVMGVLLNDNVRPKSQLGWPDPLNFPHPQPQKALPSPVPLKPRAVFKMANTGAEIWCISDLLEDLSQLANDQSSSERKIERLPRIFAGQKPDLVIAVGTACYPHAVSQNGCVVIGSKVFMHDCHPAGSNPNPNSKWNSGPFEKLIDSSLDAKTFATITNLPTNTPNSCNGISNLFLVQRSNPAGKARILCDYEYTALGVVNVTDYSEYSQTDKATMDAYLSRGSLRNAGSLETTHGLIRAQSDAPFLFVSGITDTLGGFNDEVNPCSYAQNTVAAHNAGVVVAWMLPLVDAALK